MLTAERLREVFDYDPDTGMFRRKVIEGPGCKQMLVGWTLGTNSGGVRNRGYKKINVDGTQYRAHRLAWLYVYGSWPKQEIDHINGSRADNRIANLRDVSTSVNQQNRRRPQSNNRSGVLGVSMRGPSCFVAQIRVGGVVKKLGAFRTTKAAHAAYVEAKHRYHIGFVGPEENHAL